MTEPLEQVAEQAVAEKKSRTVQTVEMTDGRSVEFAGKRRLMKNATISEDGFDVEVTLDFINGETRSFKLGANNKLFAKFAAHGMLQKLGDEVAGLEDIDDQVLAIEELIERLGRGEWGAERGRGEGNALAGLSILAKALVEVSGKTPEAIKAFLSGKSNAQKLALRENPSLKPVIARLEAAKKPKAKGDAIDSGALLDELNSGEGEAADE